MRVKLFRARLAGFNTLKYHPLPPGTLPPCGSSAPRAAACLQVVAVVVWLVWFLGWVQLLGLVAGCSAGIAKGRPRGRPCSWVWVCGAPPGGGRGVVAGVVRAAARPGAVRLAGIAKGRPCGRPCSWVWVYVMRLQVVAVVVWLVRYSISCAVR